MSKGGNKGKIEYRKEFFDREYSARDAYKRVWKYARKYKLRLLIGVICGMATAGTLVPLFQIVQPALQHAESHDAKVEVSVDDGKPARESAAATAAAHPSKPPAEAGRRHMNHFEKEIAKNSKLPGWYPKVEKFAAKLGIRLQDEKGGMGGAVVLIVCIVVPAVALLRLALMYLNHYCLSWSGAHAVTDLRQEMLEHVQRQNMQFFDDVTLGAPLSDGVLSFAVEENLKYYNK